jgi:hypothetical protein
MIAPPHQFALDGRPEVVPFESGAVVDIIGQEPRQSTPSDKVAMPFAGPTDDFVQSIPLEEVERG